MKPTPFDQRFWTEPQHTPAAANLTQIMSYITLLPIEWTKGENNNLGYHTALVTENKRMTVPETPAIQAKVSDDGRQG